MFLLRILRDLGTYSLGEAFDHLLAGIKAKQALLQKTYGSYVPVAVKIAPDMSEDELRAVADALLLHKLDGVIATNTTLSREGVAHLESGGLSGRPLRQKSVDVIRILAEHVEGKIPIIGLGGILEGRDAREKIEAGASLVQIYSGFIYKGANIDKRGG